MWIKVLINITEKWEEWDLGGASGNNVQQTEQDRADLPGESWGIRRFLLSY